MALSWKIARGSMGESNALREVMGSKRVEGVCLGIDTHVSITDNSGCLNSFSGDNLICFHGNASEYNNCKFNLEAALIFNYKSINGGNNA
jgi:hypothetical protein